MKLRLADRLPDALAGGVALAAFAVLVSVEIVRPLRRATERKLPRNLRNLAFGALSAVTIRLLEAPVTTPLAGLVERRGWGLVKVFGFPPAVEVAVSVVLLDYTLWVWHVLTHKVPFLWRFHGVHHADRDLDASTALRFHCVEMALSVPWRAAQVAVVGAAPLSLSIWQTLTLLAIMFHHSNVSLPIGIERWLSLVFMTPRLHGIHHSIVRAETDSNWGTILSLPDYLHRTVRRDVPQEAITIGRPS